MEHYWQHLKKSVCAFIAILLIIVPFAQAISPESPDFMTSSRSIIDFIEEHEGYSQYAYGDSYGYCIGYGTSCGKNDYPNGVTEEEAEQLLLDHIAVLEQKLNNVMEKYGLRFSQNQFDALISLSYNIGTAWMNTSTRLYSLLISGSYSDESFINAFGIWCHIGSTVSSALINRRIKEINIFFYGYYQGKDEAYPSHLPVINRIIFDDNGGDVEYDVQFYRSGTVYGSFPEVKKEGEAFAGWYTDEGVRIKVTDISEKNLKVTARWGDPSDAAPDPDTPSPSVTPKYDELKQYYDELANTSNWRNPFSDAYSNTWYYKYVCALCKGDIVHGYPDNTFRPNGSLTCGEALTLILTACEYSSAASSDSHWASGYYNAAVSNGIINFVDITNLDAKISRALVAKLAARAMGLSPSASASPFSDTSDGYAIALYERGIISGSYQGDDLVYLPNSNLTRAEVCVIVWNIMLDRLESLKYSANTSDNSNLGGTYPSAGNDFSSAPSFGFTVDTSDDGNCGSELPAEAPTVNPLPIIISDTQFEYLGKTYNFDPRLSKSTLSSSDFFTGIGDRIYSGKAFSCGIDVSAWQKDIDWRAVAADGIDYAIIRVGYRGYSEGGLFADPYFRKNIEGALAAGLDVGVYFFSQAVTADEAREEALFTLSLISDYNITYPVVFDWEPQKYSTSRTRTYTTEQLTICTRTFCNTIRSAGYNTCYYTNRNMGYIDYDLGALAEYDFWYAEYTESPSFVYALDMWQYSSSVKVAGIDGNTDVNLCFKNYKR